MEEHQIIASLIVNVDKAMNPISCQFLGHGAAIGGEMGKFDCGPFDSLDEVWLELRHVVAKLYLDGGIWS